MQIFHNQRSPEYSVRAANIVLKRKMIKFRIQVLKASANDIAITPTEIGTFHRDICEFDYAIAGRNENLHIILNC